MERVYIFGNEATAEAFTITAYHFGHEAKRIGSALLMEREGYMDVLDKTLAVPAAMAATVVANRTKPVRFAIGQNLGVNQEKS